MFDGKTVTAVFVSLAIIAVLTSGQQIQAPDNIGSGGGFDLGNLIPSGGDANFENRPEPNNTVEADFTADLSNETLQVYNTNLTSQGLTEIESEGIQADEPITLRGFTGDVKLNSGNVTLVGDAEGYTSSGVTVSETVQLNTTHSTSRLELETVKLQHTFNQTEGDLSSSTNDGSTAETVEFNSFSGLIVLELETDNVQMSGRVDRLESGSFVIN